jgi:hypothetical protein
MDAALLARLRGENAETGEEMSESLRAVERREELLMRSSCKLTEEHAAELQEDWQEMERLVAWREGLLRRCLIGVRALSSRLVESSTGSKGAGTETAEQGGSGGAPVPEVQASVGSKLPDGGAPSRADAAAPSAAGGPGQTPGSCANPGSSSTEVPTAPGEAQRAAEAAVLMPDTMLGAMQELHDACTQERMAAAELACSFPESELRDAAPLLAAATPEDKRDMLVERLFPLVVHHLQPGWQLARKITGMLLEMPHNELLLLLESPDALSAKVNEAIAVLQQVGCMRCLQVPPVVCMHA